MKRSASSSVPRWMLNGATLAVVAGSGLALVAAPARRLAGLRSSGIGQVVARPQDSIADVHGRKYPLLGADSSTLIVLLATDCDLCRMGARELPALVRWADDQHIAARLVFTDDTAAVAQFGRLARAEASMRLVPAAWRRRLDLQVAPTVLLLDQTGVVRARWLGEIPTHVAVLNALAHVLQRHPDLPRDHT